MSQNQIRLLCADGMRMWPLAIRKHSCVTGGLAPSFNHSNQPSLRLHHADALYAPLGCQLLLELLKSKLCRLLFLIDLY